MAMSAKEAIGAAMQRLEAARFGLEDMEQRPERFYSGLMNAVVFGRMVTFALQNMRSSVPEFEEWYAEKRGEMMADPLCRYFHDLRTQIEKRAANYTVCRTTINFNTSEHMKYFEPRPPGAFAMSIGGSDGSGWHVKGPDGEEQKYYVNVPAEVVDSSIQLNAPTELRDREAADLVREYLHKLAGLIDEARSRFLS